MKHHVAIVTDSTASIPPDVADQLNICVIQLELTIGDQENDERRIPHSELAQAMRDGTHVETGPPPPPAFFWNYNDAASSGAEAIVSVHISEGLSQTCQSARTAAEEISLPVFVVDSRLCGLGMGFPVIAAAEAAAAGGSTQGVLGVLDRRLRSTTQMIYVDTLEYLRRSGRVGRAQAFFGQALSIKPVLVLREGILEPMVKGRGPERALKKAVREAVARAGDGPVDIGIEHFQYGERAHEIAEQLRSQLPQARRVVVAETSAIIGAHAGPGALGLTVSPAT
ncbi:MULTISPECIES: DegV family protein [unclassified Saccharopolyspora]|uniref:DegV family protein n=1 Tax=unclassified Saccharopolyspora TaxID=2646250 RepID=UPI001CD3C285|nr:MULTISPECIES: DegV family protein [unclassified Saccharopolyspora]MCA1186822.1 DegV family protein [Saccharopolyspora sp. 6T]MCA1190911.1 DegV family protein [Saccharopolyspora sp. 6V]MCA1225565.1 DegV family protein [Saccharopolyspora sp. 6M]MCA1278763.1 DegV family protein [Saccharopolyspora sp. 7B]